MQTSCQLRYLASAVWNTLHIKTILVWSRQCFNLFLFNGFKLVYKVLNGWHVFFPTLSYNKRHERLLVLLFLHTLYLPVSSTKVAFKVDISTDGQVYVIVKMVKPSQLNGSELKILVWGQALRGSWNWYCVGYLSESTAFMDRFRHLLSSLLQWIVPKSILLALLEH